MPHVLLTGGAGLASFCSDFERKTVHVNDWIIKFQNCFVSHDHKTIILDTIAVRSGFSQGFYLLIEQKHDQYTIRVDPHTNVEKNEGVKRAIASVAHNLLYKWLSLQFTRSNIDPDYLGAFVLEGNHDPKA